MAVRRLLLLVSLLIPAVARVIHRDQGDLVLSAKVDNLGLRTEAKKLQLRQDLVLSEKVDNLGLRTEAENLQLTSMAKPSLTKTPTFEYFLCGKIDFGFAADLFTISVGGEFRVKMEFGIGAGVPWTLTVQGTFGGGITIGKADVLAANLYAFRTVKWEATLPLSLKEKYEKEPDKRKTAWQALKWTISKFFQRVSKESAEAKFAKIVGKQETQIARVVNRMIEIKKKLSESGDYAMTDAKKWEGKGKWAWGAAMTAQIYWHMDRAIREFVATLKTLMKKQGGQTSKNRHAAHKKLVQEAFFKTYIDNSGAMWQGQVKGIIMSLGGLIGQKETPDCRTVHMSTKSSSNSVPGFHNVLCSFLAQGTLLGSPAKVGPKETKGQAGYKNILASIEVILASFVHVNIEDVYGKSGSKGALMISHIDKFLDVTQWSFELETFTEKGLIIHAIGVQFAQTLGEKYNKECAECGKKYLRAFLNDNNYGIVANEHRCDTPQNAKHFCGFGKRTVEWAFTATVGHSGNINLCTPDTSLFQYHYMRRWEYEKMVLKRKTRSHKWVISGGPLFTVEFTKITARDYKDDGDTSVAISVEDSFEATVRVMVNPVLKGSAFDPSAYSPTDPPEDGIAAAFNDNFAKYTFPFVVGSMEALGFKAFREVSKEPSKPDEPKLFEKVKKKFFGDLKTAKAAAKPRFRQTHSATIPLSPSLVLQNIALPPNWEVFNAGTVAKALGKALSKLFQSGIESHHLLGLEMTIAFNRAGKLEGKGKIFYLQYQMAKGSSSPWSDTQGVKVAVEGYFGSQTAFEIGPMTE